MSRLNPTRTLPHGILLVLLTAACGRDSSQAAGGDTGASRAQPSAAATPSARDDGPVAFTEADLDAYERGLTKEIELVRAAQERERTATTPQARGEAMQAQWQEQTMPGGAQSAGLPLERYRRVRETVNHVLETLDFQGRIDGPLSMDTTHATPEMRQRLSSDPFAALPPASATALKARLDRLVPLWGQYVRMTAVAG